MVCLTSLNGLTAIISIILVVLQADRCLVEGAVEHKLYLSSHLQDRWRVHESFQIMASCGDIPSDECESLKSLLTASKQLTALSLIKTHFIDGGSYPGLWFSCHDGQDFQTTSLTNTADVTADPSTATAGACADLGSTSTCQAGSTSGNISTENNQQECRAQQQQPHNVANKPAAHQVGIVAQVEAVGALTAKVEASKCAELGIPWHFCPHLSPIVKQKILVRNLAAAVQQQGAACIAGQLSNMQKAVQLHDLEQQQQQHMQTFNVKLKQQTDPLEQADGANFGPKLHAVKWLCIGWVALVFLVIGIDTVYSAYINRSTVIAGQRAKQPSQVQRAPTLTASNKISANTTQLPQSAAATPAAPAAAAPAPRQPVSPPAAGVSDAGSAAAAAAAAPVSSNETPDTEKPAAAALPGTNTTESPAAAAAAIEAELAAAEAKPEIAAAAAAAAEEDLPESVSLISANAATYSPEIAAAGSTGGDCGGSSISSDDSIEGWQHVDGMKWNN